MFASIQLLKIQYISKFSARFNILFKKGTVHHYYYLVRPDEAIYYYSQQVLPLLLHIYTILLL